MECETLSTKLGKCLITVLYIFTVLHINFFKKVQILFCWLQMYQFSENLKINFLYHYPIHLHFLLFNKVKKFHSDDVKCNIFHETGTVINYVFPYPLHNIFSCTTK
jgi:hypothetical protein